MLKITHFDKCISPTHTFPNSCPRIFQAVKTKVLFFEKSIECKKAYIFNILTSYRILIQKNLPVVHGHGDGVVENKGPDEAHNQL